MKSVISVIGIFSVAIFISACDKPLSPPAASASASSAVAPSVLSAASSTKAELQIIDWGPQSAKVGQIPNKQADGSMGVWISVSNTKEFGEAQVVFGGQPARFTSVQDKAINAAVDGNFLKQAGVKDVAIKQISTGKTFSVGQFKIE